MLHLVGKKIGILLFYTLPKYRKRTLSNLSLAPSLVLEKKQLKRLAKASLGNLVITALEYGKIGKEKDLSSLVTCRNPETAKTIIKQGKGIIFFCGHQANWELFFLDGTLHMPGVAIGQPIKNHFLYRWVLSIRQRFGGKIVSPKEAVKEGLRALKQGKFLGIVGDQGMPDSGFCSPFLGRNAWTSPLPALLSYRSGCPIMTATMKRFPGSYEIYYSDPIWPDPHTPAEKEIPRLMTEALSILEKSILEAPSDWLWQHNRWKQQTLGKIKKPYRQDAIAIFLPQDPTIWQEVSSSLPVFRKLYPGELISVFTPIAISQDLSMEEHFYSHLQELEVQDYRYKLVYNFSENQTLKRHFSKLSMLTYADKKSLAKLADLPFSTPLSELLPQAILHAI